MMLVLSREVITAGGSASRSLVDPKICHSGSYQIVGPIGLAVMVQRIIVSGSAPRAVEGDFLISNPDAFTRAVLMRSMKSIAAIATAAKAMMAAMPWTPTHQSADKNSLIPKL